METPLVVRVSLLEGHVSSRDSQSTELAAVTTERWYMAPGVQRIEIRQNGIIGTLFIPPGEHSCTLKMKVKTLCGLNNTDFLQAQAHFQPCWICGEWVED